MARSGQMPRTCRSRGVDHVAWTTDAPAKAGRAAAVISAAVVAVVPSCATSRSEPVAEWVDDHAVSLTRTDPDEPIDDNLDPLRQLVGDAVVVGLGESAHGTHDQFTLKHQLARFLDERMGFRPRPVHGRHPDLVAAADGQQGHLLARELADRRGPHRDVRTAAIGASRKGRAGGPPPAPAIRAGLRLALGLPGAPTRHPHHGPHVGPCESANYLLNLPAQSSPSVQQWLNGPATMRLIGSAYDASNDLAYAMSVDSRSSAFDRVVHLQSTAATRLLN